MSRIPIRLPGPKSIQKGSKVKESDIQRCIMDGLAAKRIFAFRLNTGGTKIAGGYFRAHTLGKGAADILAFPRSLLVPFGTDRATPMRWLDGAPAVLWIECKTATGKVSQEQLSFGQRVRDEGQFHLIANCWEDVEKWLKDHKL